MKTYQYNGKAVTTMSQIKKHLGVCLYSRLQRLVPSLQLNKNLFIIPKEEARKLIPSFHHDNLVLLTREGCRILLYSVADGGRSPLMEEGADCFLDDLFGPEQQPAITIVEESSAVSLLDIDKSLSEMSTDNPLIQLIIDKAAEKVADRIVSRLSA